MFCKCFSKTSFNIFIVSFRSDNSLAICNSWSASLFSFNSCLASTTTLSSSFNKPSTTDRVVVGKYLSSSLSPVLPAQPTQLTVSPSPQYLSILLLLLLVSPLRIQSFLLIYCSYLFTNTIIRYSINSLNFIL